MMSKVLLIIDSDHFIRVKSMTNRSLVFLMMAVFGLRIPIIIAEDTLPPSNLGLPGFGIDPNTGMLKFAGELPAIGRGSLVSALGGAERVLQFGIVN